MNVKWKEKKCLTKPSYARQMNSRVNKFSRAKERRKKKSLSEMLCRHRRIDFLVENSLFTCRHMAFPCENCERELSGVFPLRSSPSCPIASHHLDICVLAVGRCEQASVFTFLNIFFFWVLQKKSQKNLIRPWKVFLVSTVKFASLLGSLVGLQTSSVCRV